MIALHDVLCLHTKNKLSYQKGWILFLLAEAVN